MFCFNLYEKINFNTSNIINFNLYIQTKCIKYIYFFKIKCFFKILIVFLILFKLNIYIFNPKAFKSKIKIMFKNNILLLTLSFLLLFSCQNLNKEETENSETTNTIENFWTKNSNFDFKGLGTEPFWNFTINKQSIHFQSLAEQINAFETELIKDEFSEKMVSFIADWDDYRLYLSIEENPCNDGMSDIEYSHQVFLKITDVNENIVLEENGCGYFLDGNENQFKEGGTALSEEELMEYYIRDWEDQLVYEEKLGRPCDFSEGDYQENAQKWLKENPNQIKGFPVNWKDINIEKYDFDNDGQLDYLLSFEEEPCAMSNALPKTYVKIIYANEEQSNSNILETVYQLIEKDFSKNYPNLKLKQDYSLNLVNYNTLENGKLTGQATLYLHDDYKTSPSYGAQYKYNPHSNKIELDFYKN